jgi:hypothetical protein
LIYGRRIADKLCGAQGYRYFHRSSEDWNYLQRNRNLRDYLQGTPKIAADGTKRGLDFTGEALHRSDRSERDDGDDECIFDKVLTIFGTHQLTEPEIHTPK